MSFDRIQEMTISLQSKCNILRRQDNSTRSRQAKTEWGYREQMGRNTCQIATTKNAHLY